MRAPQTQGKNQLVRIVLFIGLCLSLIWIASAMGDDASHSASARSGEGVWLRAHQDGSFFVRTPSLADQFDGVGDLSRIKLRRLRAGVTVALDFTRMTSINDALLEIGMVDLDAVSLRGPVDLFLQQEMVQSLQHATRLAFSLTRCDDKSLAHFLDLYGERVIALGLDETGITNGAGSAIGRIVNLESLTLRHTDVGDAILDDLGALRGLVYLDLANTNMTGHGGRRLGELTGLRTLRLSGTRVTDDVVAHLTQLPKLVFLDLSNTQIGDGIAPALQRLTGLQALSLRNTKTTSHVGGGLAHMKAIELLDLRETAVDNDIGVSFEPMTGLRQLFLSGTRVGDPVTEYLSGLDNLQKLSLERTRVTTIAVKQLDAKLLDCKVAF